MLKQLIVVSLALSPLNFFASEKASEIKDAPVAAIQSTEGMIQIQKTQDLEQFMCQWVVFTGLSSRFVQEQTYVFDPSLALKAGYVSRRTYPWKSGHGQVLHRVLRSGARDYTYSLNEKHIKEHNQSLYMRNMTQLEMEIISQALDKGMAKCHLPAAEKRDDCLMQ